MSFSDRIVQPSPSPNDPEQWIDELARAFADHTTSEFLPRAEEAVRAHPSDANILCLAATAALLDEQPDRALVFLKRLSKRYSVSEVDYLLHALALAQQKKAGAARLLLERHFLTLPYVAVRS